MLFLSGAVGVALAALIYFLSLSIEGLLHGLAGLDGAEVIVFLILLATALAEMPMMVVGLRLLRARQVPPVLLYGMNIGYVAFAAVYALIQATLFGASVFSMLLAGLSIARWGSDFVVGA